MLGGSPWKEDILLTKVDELLQDEAVVSFLIAVSDVDAYPAKTHLTRALKSYLVDEADVQVAEKNIRECLAFARNKVKHMTTGHRTNEQLLRLAKSLKTAAAKAQVRAKVRQEGRTSASQPCYDNSRSRWNALHE